MWRGLECTRPSIKRRVLTVIRESQVDRTYLMMVVRCRSCFASVTSPLPIRPLPDRPKPVWKEQLAQATVMMISGEAGAAPLAGHACLVLESRPPGRSRIKSVPRAVWKPWCISPSKEKLHCLTREDCVTNTPIVLAGRMRSCCRPWYPSLFPSCLSFFPTREGKRTGSMSRDKGGDCLVCQRCFPR